MWDTVQSTNGHLSHDLPCVHCGHAPHNYLPCDHGCDCGGSLAIDATREVAGPLA